MSDQQDLIDTIARMTTSEEYTPSDGDATLTLDFLIHKARTMSDHLPDLPDQLKYKSGQRVVLLTQDHDTREDGTERLIPKYTVGTIETLNHTHPKNGPSWGIKWAIDHGKGNVEFAWTVWSEKELAEYTRTIDPEPDSDHQSSTATIRRNATTTEIQSERAKIWNGQLMCFCELTSGPEDFVVCLRNGNPATATNDDGTVSRVHMPNEEPSGSYCRCRHCNRIIARDLTVLGFPAWATNRIIRRIEGPTLHRDVVMMLSDHQISNLELTGAIIGPCDKCGDTEALMRRDEPLDEWQCESCKVARTVTLLPKHIIGIVQAIDDGTEHVEHMLNQNDTFRFDDMDERYRNCAKVLRIIGTGEYDSLANECERVANRLVNLHDQIPF